MPLRSVRELYDFIAGNCLVTSGWPDILLMIEGEGMRLDKNILFIRRGDNGAATGKERVRKVSLEFMAELARRAKQIFPVAP